MHCQKNWFILSVVVFFLRSKSLNFTGFFWKQGYAYKRSYVPLYYVTKCVICKYTVAKTSTAPSNYTGRCKVVIFDFPSRNLYELPEMGLIKSWFCSSKDIITAYVSKIKQGVLGCITLIFNVLLENVIIWVIMKLFLKKKGFARIRNFA